MRKILTYFVFPVAIIILAFFLYKSINEPVKFNKERSYRESVAIEQMKDIRTLQVAFKDTYGHYAPVMDSLIDFYNNGKITIMKSVGLADDSTFIKHTQAAREAIIKANRGIKEKQINEKLFAMSEAGDKYIIASKEMPVNVKDTLFNNKAFNPEKLRYIPFSEGDTVIMQTVVKQVSGVDVPLFQAQMPFNSLLKGLDHQQIVNLNFERTDTDRYPGLMVGSIENANNNAGNWE